MRVLFACSSLLLVAIGAFAPASATAKTMLPNSTVLPASVFDSGGDLPDRQLYSFQGGDDGFSPDAGVVVDNSGNVFGTTVHGGNASCFYGCGTVFELVRTATGYVKQTIHEFDGTDSAFPQSVLTLGAGGTLYGTTSGGGIYGGSAFELIPTSSGYRENVLHLFGVKAGDGAFPCSSRLIVKKDGAIFGTTASGGSAVNGIVFRLEPKGTKYDETVLFDFATGTGGRYPFGNVVLDNEGRLIGEAEQGGAHNGGVVYMLTRGPSGYQETILHDFAGSPTDGASPQNDFLIDKSGNLFGTTFFGGKYESDTYCSIGCGTAFELVKSGGVFQEAVLHNFKYPPSDGSDPVGLAFGPNGALYGATFGGGRTKACAGASSCGMVFALIPSSSGYREEIVHRFHFNQRDGYVPMAGVFVDKGKHLYGSTDLGGSGVYSECGNPTQGCGTVFRINLR